MNILIFTSSYFPVVGGVAEVIRNLTKIYRARGHRVLVIADREGLDLPIRDTVDGTDVLRYDFPLWTRRPRDIAQFLAGVIPSLCRLRRDMEQFRPDLVNVHVIWRFALYPLILSFQKNLPLVVSLHGTDAVRFAFESILDWIIYRQCLHRAMMIVFNSENLLGIGQEAMPQLRQKMVMVGNGVDLEEFDTASPFIHPRPYIFSAGRLIYKKGFDVLIEAFGQISKEVEELDLIIAGSGSEMPILQKRVEELELGNRVFFLGDVDHSTVVSLFRGCEFSALASRWEAFGISNLESFAARKAVVSTRTGGIPEYVREGYDGVLVTAGDSRDLARALWQLHSDPIQRKTFGENGRKVAEERYTWQLVADRYLAIYERSIKDGLKNAP